MPTAPFLNIFRFPVSIVPPGRMAKMVPFVFFFLGFIFVRTNTSQCYRGGCRRELLDDNVGIARVYFGGW